MEIPEPALPPDDQAARGSLPAEPGNAWGQFVLGLLFGGGLGVAAVPLGLLAAFAIGGEGGTGPGTWLAAFAPGSMELLFAALLVARPRSRRFGLGMLVGVVIGAFTLAAICGGLT